MCKYESKIRLCVLCTCLQTWKRRAFCWGFITPTGGWRQYYLLFRSTAGEFIPVSDTHWELIMHGWIHWPSYRINIFCSPYVCFSVKNGTFAMPSLEQLMQYRIIVTTLHTARVLSLLGMQKGHFTHIFIDEAAQVLQLLLITGIDRWYPAARNHRGYVDP